MKQLNNYHLDFKGKMNKSLYLRLSSHDYEQISRALEKLNELSPRISFSQSDFVRMALLDMVSRIIHGKVDVVIDIPERKLSIYSLKGGQKAKN